MPFHRKVWPTAADDGQEGHAQEELQLEIKLCSVVMKAVQCSHPAVSAFAAESAGKLGDDALAGKVQFDRRLSPRAQQRTQSRLLQLSRERLVDSAAASSALAAAYHAVTREGILM
jgi:hypothetical protein